MFFGFKSRECSVVTVLIAVSEPLRTINTLSTIGLEQIYIKALFNLFGKDDDDELGSEIQWVKPTPLKGNRANMIEFPVTALPPVLRDMACAVAETTSTDVSMAATAILSMISYCFSGQYRIAGKKDHNEPLVIDSLIVAEASFKKSPVMKLISQPYQEFVREYNEKNKEMILENRAKKKVLTNKLSALEKNPDADTKEMSRLSIELSNITNADFRRIIVDDITPESLVRQLSVNGTLDTRNAMAKALEEMGHVGGH